MWLSNQKEEFSFAYVHAVASAAGCTVGNYRVDSDSVDCLIKSPHRYKVRWSPEINAQLKCSASIRQGTNHINFRLKAKNYGELRGNLYSTPRILVVIHVPLDVDYWIQHEPQQMVLRHCGYWVSLRDEDEKPGQETVTVKIPTENQFTVDALRCMMQRIGDRGDL